MSESYTGVQKAAILLITLGPEKAATIFKHLKEDEIEELTLEIIRFALRNSILQRAVLIMQKNCWRKLLAAIRHRELLQN